GGGGGGGGGGGACEWGAAARARVRSVGRRESGERSFKRACAAAARLSSSCTLFSLSTKVMMPPSRANESVSPTVKTLAPRNGLRVCGKKFFSDDVMKRMWQDFISASFLACFAGRSAWRRPGVSSPRR